MATAVIDKLVALDLPWLQAAYIADGTIDADVLIAYGMHPVLANEVAAVDGLADTAGNRALYLPRLMSAGMPAQLTLEVFDLLADG